ncbi:protein translocase subunit SecF [Janibacter cremeus]|uniref:Protein-export membrane protein SecF n=1 Tax=Janibacter cremeus TaxID=1285192 RepID=A0A852VM66_9MICO|nr:protein translocase subunit SecF [Janibacter cremeus]NYF96708.1 preprotein translocase subunit SecF [Janibacter cremeus]
MSRVADWGNDLYTGRRSFNFVGRSKTWYKVSAVLLVIAALGFIVRPLNFSLEFTGGSEFRVATQQAPADYESRATQAVREVVGSSASANVSTVGGDIVRVQTEELPADEIRDVNDELATAFDVKSNQISSNLIGPSWGESVSKQALRALVVFLLLTTLMMTLYYRNWKMAVSSMVALAHDMFITVGIYTWVGFEVSPASLIGFLTVLGYSLYDTVVVFDHVKENTRAAFANRRKSFAEAANLAVNQTLVRSINTTVIAVLPIIAVLVIGFAYLGPGTLLDLSLALFIGMSVGAVSSIFIATPLLVDLRRRDPEVVQLADDAEKFQARRQRELERTTTGPELAPVSGAPGAATAAKGESASSPSSTVDGGSAPVEGDAQTVTGRKVHKYAQSPGPRNQPKKTPRKRRRG